MPDVIVIIAGLAIVAVAFGAIWWWRHGRVTMPDRRNPRAILTRGPIDAVNVAALAAREYPEAGVLVAQPAANATSGSDLEPQLPTAWLTALQDASVPMALEYRPVGSGELKRFHTVPINATMQRAITDVVREVGPKGPTLFTVVLPKGAELARAVGQSGFRGFARGAGGRVTAQAILTPVGVAGAAAVSWPVLAVAGTVMALDMVAQREQRAFQQRIAAVLARLDERADHERLARQRAVDRELSGAISRLLDGQDPGADWGAAKHRARHELELTRIFIEKYSGKLDKLAVTDGKIDYDQLSRGLDGSKQTEGVFYQELAFARFGAALGRKSVLADATHAALRDPADAGIAFRRFLEADIGDVAKVGRELDALLDRIGQLTLTKKPWRTKADLAIFQSALVASIGPPKALDTPPLQILAMPSGEILQVTPVDPRED